MHGDDVYCPEEIVARGRSFMANFFAVHDNMKRDVNCSAQCTGYVRRLLSIGVVKVNVDGALFGNAGVGLGALVRDCEGRDIRG